MARLSKEERNQLKAERATVARAHIEYTEKEFAAEICHSIDHTKEYSPDSFTDTAFPRPKSTRTDCIVCDSDSVSAAFQYSKPDKKTAVLNFADYTRIGGKFLEGSFAQEECLCHESTLFSVQKAHKRYYEKNAEIGKNDGMYHNRALYSPDVVFIRHDLIKTFDVITCAAPNFWRQTFGKVSKEENDRYLKSRIRFVLQTARDNNVDILILGAFGCGVFSQDPYRVSAHFKEYLDGEFAGVFETALFPIPGAATKNHLAFAEAFG